LASENCESSFRRILDVTDEPSASGSDAAPFVCNEKSKKAHGLKRKRADGVLDALDSKDSDSDEQPARYKRVQVYCRPPAELERAGQIEREPPRVISTTETVSDPLILDTDGLQYLRHEAQGVTAATERPSLVLDVPREEQHMPHELSNRFDNFYDSDELLPRSPLLEPIRPNFFPSPTPPPPVLSDCSSSYASSASDAEAAPLSNFQESFYGIYLSEKSKRKRRRRHRPSQGDIFLISYLHPHRPDIAQQAGSIVLNSASQSEAEN
jgi:hypothetical protein